MSKISCGIPSRAAVDLSDFTPSGLREYMVASIDALLRQIPGNSINEKMPTICRALGFREGRVNEYRHRKINRPYADEVWAVINHAERVAAGNVRRAELRRNNEDLKNAFSGMGDQAECQAALLRIAGDDAIQRNVGGSCQELAGAHGIPHSALGRFAGGVLDVQEIGIDGARHSHQRIIEAIGQTAGEFTLAVSEEMERLGLADLTWLYRAEEALPTLHVGNGINILSAEDRARIVGNPIAEQPLPPALLSLVSAHLHACMHEKARPTVHRIKASIGGRIHVYDRLAVHFPRSHLVASACAMVAA
jgi:hypothetical protein